MDQRIKKIRVHNSVSILVQHLMIEKLFSGELPTKGQVTKLDVPIRPVLELDQAARSAII